MKVLVTGGTGVIGQAAVTSLVARGHRVRLLSRGAEEARRQWPAGVASRAADVSRPDSLGGTAEGCDAVLHVAGIARESEGQTFQTVNVEGTRALLEEAERAGVRRFAFVSSLGADRGSSPYHRSKRAAEDLVRGFAPEWVVVRPGNVYGPGDEVVSQLLKMTRALPAVPLVEDGRQPFQAIWHEDLGLALALALERDDLAGETLEVAGPEVTSMADIVSRLAALDDRAPVRVPLPAALVRTAARAAAWLNLPFPVDENKLAMLEEENVVRGENALVSRLGVKPTPLDEGLRRLVASLPEQTAADGVGRLQRKRFWAAIEGSSLTPAQLRAAFLENMGRLLPLEGGPPEGTRPRVGSVFTLELPLRGVIEMRFAESKPGRLVFLTLAGHPLAGALVFHFGRGPRFEVETLVRPAGLADAVGLAAGGGLLQDATWRETVARVVEVSGGRARGGVQQESSDPDDVETGEIERWMAELVTARKRAEHARVGPEGPAASRPRGLGGEPPAPRPLRGARTGRGRAPARARADRPASPASGRTGRPRRSTRASSR
jgi:NADH dehydrogenase